MAEKRVLAILDRRDSLKASPDRFDAEQAALGPFHCGCRAILSSQPQLELQQVQQQTGVPHASLVLEPVTHPNRIHPSPQFIHPSPQSYPSITWFHVQSRRQDILFQMVPARMTEPSSDVLKHVANKALNLILAHGPHYAR